MCPPTVLLRIEFTASDSLQPMGELLPRLSILTRRRPREGAQRRRFISVALFLKSPSAGVTRYPCPVEPGLSSWRAFRRRHATACLTRLSFYRRNGGLSTNGAGFFSGEKEKWACRGERRRGENALVNPSSRWYNGREEADGILPGGACGTPAHQIQTRPCLGRRARGGNIG